MILKKGFTLSEIMIAMATLGIIVAACVPIILNMTPNKNAIMIKKAYYTTVQIVNDLVNDQVYYPDEDFSELTAENGPIVGLSYFPDSTIIPGTNQPLQTSPLTDRSQRRFSCLFASKLTIPSTDLIEICNLTRPASNGMNRFTLATPDGLTWNFIHCPFGSGNDVNNWSWADNDVCRIDVAVGLATDGTYSAVDDASFCSSNGAWALNGSCNDSSDKLSTINKAAFFISRDGNITLSGTAGTTGFSNGQPIIQEIIDGRRRLLGK